MDNFDFILDNINNKTVFESLVKAKEKLKMYDKIAVSISGGGRQRFDARPDRKV